MCGPDEAAAFERFCDWLERLYRVEMPHFIERNYDSPARPGPAPGAGVELVRLGRLRAAGQDGGPPLPRRPAAPAVHLPVALRRAWPPTRPWPSTPSSPTWTSSTASSSPRAASTPCRWRWRTAAEKAGAPVPLRHPGRAHPAASAATTGPSRACAWPGGEVVPARAVVCNADLPGAYRTLLPGLRPPRGRPHAALLALRRRVARRAPGGTLPAGRRPPQHPLRRARGRARSGRCCATGCACPTRRCWSRCRRVERAVDGARPGPPRALRARAGAQPRRQRRLGDRAPPGTRRPGRGRRPARATRPTSRSRPWSPPTTGRPRGSSGARRSRCRTGSARRARSGPATSTARAPGLVFTGSATGAGRGRADGAGVRRAGRRAGGRPVSARCRDVTLDESYARCRELNRRHGTTYYWSAYALPRASRPHVWALYAFCRYADDIVDDLGDVPGGRAGGGAVPTSATGSSPTWPGAGPTDPILMAVVDTVRALRPRPRLLPAVPAVDGHGPDRRHLRHLGRPARLHGRLGRGHRRDDAADPRPTDPAAALGPARDLGFAFQLTNFLRDVAEDLDRGRVYIPQKDLARFGADPARRVVDDSWVRADAVRVLAGPGAVRVGGRRDRRGCRRPRPAACARALVLYSGIITAIEDGRLRRVPPPCPGPHLAQGGDRRPHLAPRAAVST